eukprot:123209-Amphidinium_carterae.1
MHQHPNIFNRFAMAYRYHTTTQHDRINFQEFMQLCRHHSPNTQPSYIIADHNEYNIQPNDPPQLILTEDQLPCVRFTMEPFSSQPQTIPIPDQGSHNT